MIIAQNLHQIHQAHMEFIIILISLPLYSSQLHQVFVIIFFLKITPSFPFPIHPFFSITYRNHPLPNHLNYLIQLQIFSSILFISPFFILIYSHYDILSALYLQYH
jgi:hypothetical protein